MSGRHGLQIRRAGVGDAAGLGQLLAEAGIGVAAATLARRIEAMDAAAGTVLLADEWGPPSGVISVHWYRHLGDDHPAARIDLLLVAVEARRRGIGRLLVKAAARSARSAGCQAIALETTDAVEGLPAFARASGFAVRGTTLMRGLRREG